MTDIRKLINIVAEDDNLKKQVIGAVKATDDENVLQRVLKTLQAGNIEDRIKAVVSQDADASQFVNQIAKIIIEIDSPLEEKEAFLKQYPKGIIDIKKLLNKKQSSFSDLAGSNFATKLLVELSTQLVSQGVGPGEIALAAFSPNISWSGRKVGGGDIQIGNQAVEVKTRVSKGGRWINARKARMNLGAIPEAIQATAARVIDKHFRGSEEQFPEVPARLNPSLWVNSMRPMLAKEPKMLKELCNLMAKALFNQTDNSRYVKALYDGSPEDIVEAILDVGYENYKAYSGFDGILLMDIPTQATQYFTTYAEMEGKVKASTAYIYAPESEAMPQVVLVPEGGVGKKAVGAATDTEAIPTKTSKTQKTPAKRVDITPPGSRATRGEPTKTPRARR